MEIGSTHRRRCCAAPGATSRRVGSRGSVTLQTKQSLEKGKPLFITLVAVNPSSLASLPLRGKARAMGGASGSGEVLHLIFGSAREEQRTYGRYGHCLRYAYGSACSHLSAAARVAVHESFAAGQDADGQVEVNVLAASWTCACRTRLAASSSSHWMARSVL